MQTEVEYDSWEKMLLLPSVQTKLVVVIPERAREMRRADVQFLTLGLSAVCRDLLTYRRL